MDDENFKLNATKLEGYKDKYKTAKEKLEHLENSFSKESDHIEQDILGYLKAKSELKNKKLEKNGLFAAITEIQNFIISQLIRKKRIYHQLASILKCTFDFYSDVCLNL